MKPITWFGTLLALVGILGLTIPAFTTSRSKDLVKLGNIKIQSTERSTHLCLRLCVPGALVLGVILIGAGLYRSR